MSNVRKYSREQFRITAVLALPLLLFTLLRLFSDLDTQAWGLSWWYTRLIQFYTGSFASLIALIAASFAGSTLGNKTSPRSMFTTVAFVNISAFLLISSIATPTVIIPGKNNDAFIWSLRFAFPAGALFFYLATVRWRADMSNRVVRYNRLLWMIGILTLVSYATIAFGFPQWFRVLDFLAPVLPQILAIVAITLLLAAAWRTWQSDWVENDQVKHRLAIVLILLAEAQIFQAFGTPGQFSWLLYHPTILVALLFAVSAILFSFESAQDIQFNQYFFIVGIIVIGGLSLIIGELGTRWLNDGVNRTSVIGMVLVQGALSFIVLYVIVLYLNRLIQERTAALRHEQYLRNELTHLIVHDLKSPLSVITSGINLLTKGHLGSLSATQGRLLSSLENSGQQILYMINDLLDVERMETGALTLQLSHVSMPKLLQDLVNAQQIVARTHKQTLSLSYPSALSSVRVDKGLLQRVVNNLLTNALKFTPEDGQIKVSMLEENGYLLLQVADDGPGVPEADRERIFEKFGQVKGTERRGAGLGLTFCKMVIEAHDGMLAVEDSELGGALFKVWLPLPPPLEIEVAASQKYGDSDWSLETS